MIQGPTQPHTEETLARGGIPGQGSCVSELGSNGVRPADVVEMPVMMVGAATCRSNNHHQNHDCPTSPVGTPRGERAGSPPHRRSDHHDLTLMDDVAAPPGTTRGRRAVRCHHRRGWWPRRAVLENPDLPWLMQHPWWIRAGPGASTCRKSLVGGSDRGR